MKARKNNITKWTFTASSVLLLAVSFCTFSCTSNKIEEIKAISSRENLATLIMKDLETVITDSGKVKYRFRTPELLQYPQKQEPYTDLPKGLDLIIYLSNGDVDAQIKCMNAVYLEKSQLWELNNNVEAINQKGEILNTEQLFWNMKEHTLYSEKFVKITREKEIITGTGFDADESMRNWEIRNVSGILELSE